MIPGSHPPKEVGPPPRSLGLRPFTAATNDRADGPLLSIEYTSPRAIASRQALPPSGIAFAALSAKLVFSTATKLQPIAPSRLPLKAGSVAGVKTRAYFCRFSHPIHNSTKQVTMAKRRSRARARARRRKRDPLLVDGQYPRPLYVDYKDVDLLKKMTNRQGKIIGRRKSGCAALSQHAITKAVKRARYMALLPYVGE